MTASPLMKKKPKTLDVDEATWQAILQAQEELRRMPPSREGHEYNSRTQSRAAAQTVNCNATSSAARMLTPKAQYKKAYSKKAFTSAAGKEVYHENGSKWSSKRSHDDTSSEEEEEERAPSKERETPKVRKKAKHTPKSERGQPEDMVNAPVTGKATTQKKREAVAAGGVRKVMMEVLSNSNEACAGNGKGSHGVNEENTIASDAEWELGLGAELRSARQLAIAIASLRPDLPQVRFESTEGKGHSLLRSQDPALRAQNSQHLRHGRFKKAHLVDIYRNLVRKNQSNIKDGDDQANEDVPSDGALPGNANVSGNLEGSLLEVANTLYTFRMNPACGASHLETPAAKVEEEQDGNDLRSAFVQMFLDCVEIGEKEGAPDCTAADNIRDKVQLETQRSKEMSMSEDTPGISTPPLSEQVASMDEKTATKTEGSFESPQRMASPEDEAVRSPHLAPPRSPIHMVSTTVRNMDEIGFWFVSQSRPSNAQLRDWASIVPAFVQWRRETERGTRNAVTAARVRAALARLYKVYSVRGPRVTSEHMRKELVKEEADVKEHAVGCHVDITHQLSGKVIKIEEVTASGAEQSVVAKSLPAEVLPHEVSKSIAVDPQQEKKPAIEDEENVCAGIKRENIESGKNLVEQVSLSTEEKAPSHEETEDHPNEVALRGSDSLKEIDGIQVKESVDAVASACAENVESPLVSAATVTTAIAAATATARGQEQRGLGADFHSFMAHDEMRDKFQQDACAVEQTSDHGIVDSQAHEAILGLVHGPSHGANYQLVPEKMKVGL